MRWRIKSKKRAIANCDVMLIGEREINAMLDIVNYLRKHHDMFDVIPVAISSARKYLPEAELAMRVYNDPEISDSFLVIYVRAKEYNEDIMRRIELAEDEFIDLLAGKSGWIQLTIRY